jgi:hypothetical protein
MPAPLSSVKGARLLAIAGGTVASYATPQTTTRTRHTKVGNKFMRAHFDGGLVEFPRGAQVRACGQGMNVLRQWRVHYHRNCKIVFITISRLRSNTRLGLPARLRAGQLRSLVVG